jgi:diguanylate cyclase (GGDEF)-like protein/PAS domain S-box-containing protein
MEAPRVTPDAESALRESEAGLRHAQEMAGLAYVVVGPGGEYERYSETFPHLLGCRPAELPRSTRESLALLHPEDREHFRAQAIDAARASRRTMLEYRMYRGDGPLIHILQTMEPIGAPDARGYSRWFVTMLDVTEQKRAEERIRRLNRVYAVLSGINGAIVRIRERQELFAEACRIAVELGGFRFAWIAGVDAAAGRLAPEASAGDGRDLLERLCARLSLRDDAPRGHGIVARALRENRALFVNQVEGSSLILEPALAERGVRSVGVLPISLGGKPVAALGLNSTEPDAFDEQEQRLLQELAGDIGFGLDHIEKEEKVRYLAYYDQLTGLANRSLLLERLAQQLDAARTAGQSLALVIVNLERFKIVNDTLGRQVGDELLRQIAARVRLAAGDESRVARVGADQFAIVVPDLGPHEELAQRLQKGHASVTRDPFVIDGRELRVSFRSGVALFPADAADAESLFRNAEAALKRSRSGELFVLYTQEMTERIAEDLELENRLRRAVERGEFVLHYQPKFDLATRKLTGAEALIRWASPDDAALVPPSKFIPMLEQTGLIARVGPWALARAVEDQRSWRVRGFAVPRVSVNVSAVELRRPEFVSLVKEALARGANPAIDLEITESLLMENVEQNVDKLKELRAIGVGVAIDDFGTGYSSLGYLARLPVQSLKIDRSFIVTMFEDADIMTLVSTVISLAHTLHLKVVAEGVDSEAQAKILRSLRCDEVQGYLYSEPLAPEAFASLLTAQGQPAH